MSITFIISYTLLWVLVIIQGLTIIGLIKVVEKISRSTGANERSTSGPESLLGKPAPAFRTTDINGVVHHINQGTSSKIMTLLFVSPSCPLCMQALSSIDSYANKTRDNLLIFCHSSPDNASRLAHDYMLRYPVIPNKDGDIFDLYKVDSLPVAVQVSSDGIILSVGREAYSESASISNKSDAHLSSDTTLVYRERVDSHND